jgi:hypothetical protein
MIKRDRQGFGIARDQHRQNLDYDQECRVDIKKQLGALVKLAERQVQRSTQTAGQELAADKAAGLARWDLEVLISIRSLQDHLGGNGFMHAVGWPGCPCPTCTWKEHDADG